MHFRTFAFAAVLLAIAGTVVAAPALPLVGMTDRTAPATTIAQRKYADCHRDVRTHWIFGVLIRHRHVGDNCAVREVKKLKSF